MAEHKAVEPVAKLALENSALQKRIAVLEDLLTSAYNISNRNGENTHWDRFSSQLFINGIRHVTAKTFKILPSDTTRPTLPDRLQTMTEHNEGEPINLNYEVKTIIFESGFIENTVQSMTSDISRQIINTQDEHTKEALIKLGWSPPSDNLSTTAEYEQLKADAERYRWLRNSAIYCDTLPTAWCVYGDSSDNNHPCDEVKLDEAINQARTKK